jgi:flagellar motor switch protein FliG
MAHQKKPTTGPRPNRIKELCETINALSPDERTKLLANIAQEDPTLAVELEAAMFPFSDLAKLRTEHLLLVLQRCERGDILLALKKCDEDLRNQFLSTQTNRAKQTLLEEIATMPPTPLSAVAAAQARIAAIAKSLEDAGTISRRSEDWV